MTEEWEWDGKSDGCDSRVSIARDAWLEVDYQAPAVSESFQAVGKSECSTVHRDTHKTHRHTRSTSTWTRALCKCDSRIPGRFDPSAAVMSLVVKLLFPFNIVYRHRHLSEETVICPLLRYASNERYQPSVHCCRASLSLIYAEIWCLNPSTYFGDLAIFIHPIDDLRLEAIKIMATTGSGLFMHCMWDVKRKAGKCFPSSTFPLSILIRLLIYLFL